ncbi:glycosyltransferase family 8 protein, partial [Campylobacter molothri]|uniref:glycosyltransferase family 8 protein n=1 Tax=Campylobacter molothri TaxID=1032242 RepID=UPI00301D2AC0|nr:glycosyltransferase family 8 protein [Campylobacter sp. RM10542]
MLKYYNIVISCDNNYVKYAAVVIASIIKNTKTNSQFKKYPYRFYILSNDISEDNILKLKKIIEYFSSNYYSCELIIHKIDDSKFHKFPKAWHVNHATYYRFEIADIVDGNKCLYLDADTLICWDIRELFYIELNNKVVGVVTDSCSRLWTKLYTKNGKVSSCIEFDPIMYFNAGVMLIDLNQWKKYDIKKKCIEAFNVYDHGGLADQSYLNIALKGLTYKLPLNWNLIVPEYILLNGYERHYVVNCLDENSEYNLAYTRSEFKEAIENKKIVHFCAAKPWWNLYYKDDRIDFKERKVWWDIALGLEEFREEFYFLKNSLDNDHINRKLNIIEWILKNNDRNSSNTLNVSYSVDNI